MQDLAIHLLLLLCLASFFAGFVDSMVGGGGLIQVPIALILLPNVPVANILATLKIPAFAGTSLAAYHYNKNSAVQAKLLLPLALVAFMASMLGSSMASIISNELFKPIIFFILIAVAIYTYTNKQFGQASSKQVQPRQAFYISLLIGLVIGFYDGFIGPGTGSFLLLLFVSVLGFNFLQASAHAKLVNVATNLASVLYFGFKGLIVFKIALPMAAANILGNYCGVKLALLKGNKFIRVLFLTIVAATLIRFGWDIYGMLK